MNNRFKDLDLINSLMFNNHIELNDLLSLKERLFSLKNNLNGRLERLKHE